MTGGFVDVLTTALRWRICDLVRAPHMGHSAGVCKNPRPVPVDERWVEILVEQGWTPPPSERLF